MPLFQTLPLTLPHTPRPQRLRSAENDGVENTGMENAGTDRRGGKCRSENCRSRQSMESRKEKLLSGISELRRRI